MKKTMRILAAALLALLMPLQAASASIAGLDGALADYLDINSDVRYSFSIQAQQLVPYGEETVTMMNGLLGHIRVAASHTGGDEAGESALSLSVDGESLMDMTQRHADGRTVLTTSLLPNRTLVSADSAMDAFSGAASGEEAPFDALLAIKEAEGCYTALTDAIIPYAEEKKANYKIKNIAASRWSRIARLTPEQSAELAPLIANLLGCGMDAAFRAELAQMTYSKGFIVGLYQAEQGGEDLAVYIKGGVTMGDGTTRQLSYQWAFTGGPEDRKDTYKFELTKGKGDAENRTISASYRRKEAEGAFSLKGEWSATVKRGASSVTAKAEHDLSGVEQAGVRTLEGTVVTSEKTSADGDSETITTTLTPAIKLTSSEGSGVISGTVALEEKLDKSVQKAWTLTFDEEPAQAFAQAAQSGELYAVAPDAEYDPMPQSSLNQNEDRGGAGSYLVGQPPIGYQVYAIPGEMQTFDLDAAGEEQLDALMAEAAQNLAGRLLTALAKLPAEDAALLADNMSEEDYAAFLTLIEGL